MKIIFAQGNPESGYKNTRHNVGFAVLDALATKYDGTFTTKPKFIADCAEITVHGEKLFLVKPSTFYNETGNSARAILDFYKLDASTDFLVVHDELALPFGTIRTRGQGSDAGNNGIKSLNAHLGQNYARIRFGVFNDLRNRMDDAEFVLSKFNAEETTTLQNLLIPKAIELIQDFANGGLESTSHTLNGDPKAK